MMQKEMFLIKIKINFWALVWLIFHNPD